MFSNLNEDFPTMKITLNIDRTQNLTGQVREGSLDCALVVNKGESDSYFSDLLFEDHLSLFISNSLRIEPTFVENIDKYGVAGLPIISDENQVYYTSFLRQIGLHNKHIKFESDSFDLILDMVLKKQFIGVLPEHMAKKYSNDIIPLRSDEGNLLRFGKHTINMITRKNIEPQIRRSILRHLETFTQKFLN